MSTSPLSNSGPEEITQPNQVPLEQAFRFFNGPAISDTMYLQLWSPPADPDKPRLPYLPGFTLHIDRHVPPGSSEDSSPVPEPHLSQDYLESLPQSELITNNPPMETAPPANPETAQLVVTTLIAVGASRGAQVVGCTVYPQPDKDGKSAQPFRATAKIYDPLYYDFMWEISDHARNVIFQAENDYSTEANAYEHLQSAGKTGSLAPAYYGSWTFCLPISINGKSQTRHVRLILIERLDGITIYGTRVKNHTERDMGLDSFHYPEQFRLEVLARAMESFARLLHVGLEIRYFTGRNVFLVQNHSDSSTPSTETSGGLPLPRIVLIDYSHSSIMHLGGSLTRPALPENPITLYLRYDISGRFAGWAPLEWDVEREWLLQRFYNSGQNQLYLPLRERDAERLGVAS